MKPRVTKPHSQRLFMNHYSEPKKSNHPFQILFIYYPLKQYCPFIVPIITTRKILISQKSDTVKWRAALKKLQKRTKLTLFPNFVEIYFENLNNSKMLERARDNVVSFLLKTLEFTNQ